jgi:hypothetical protein
MRGSKAARSSRHPQSNLIRRRIGRQPRTVQRAQAYQVAPDFARRNCRAREPINDDVGGKLGAGDSSGACV